MVNTPRTLDGAFNRFRLNNRIDPSPNSVLNEIDAGIRRICKFYIKQKDVVYPSAEERAWVEFVLTNRYINSIQSSMDNAHNYQCMAIDGVVYQIKCRADGWYTLSKGTQTILLSPGEYHNYLSRCSVGESMRQHELAVKGLKAAIIDKLWQEAGKFPYFDSWSKKIGLESNITKQPRISVQKRLKNYRQAVQGTTSPEIIDCVKQYITGLMPGFQPPLNPKCLDQVLDAAFPGLLGQDRSRAPGESQKLDQKPKPQMTRARPKNIAPARTHKFGPVPPLPVFDIYRESGHL